MTRLFNPFGSRDGRQVAIIMKTGLNATLDPTRRDNVAQDSETALPHKIVGQDPAIEKVTEIYQMFLAGLNPTGRPVGDLRAATQLPREGFACNIVIDWRFVLVVAVAAQLKHFFS